MQWNMSVKVRNHRIAMVHKLTVHLYAVLVAHMHSLGVFCPDHNNIWYFLSYFFPLSHIINIGHLSKCDTCGPGGSMGHLRCYLHGGSQIGKAYTWSVFIMLERHMGLEDMFAFKKKMLAATRPCEVVLFMIVSQIHSRGEWIMKKRERDASICLSLS